MDGYTGADLAAAGAFSLALFSALLMLAMLARAREDLLVSRPGWLMVAAALGLFAIQGLGRLMPHPEIAWVEPVTGILAALLLPSGLYLVLRAGSSLEVAEDAP